MNRESLLLTDLYQLTMLQSYFEEGMNETAVFEFFVRKMPAQRNFLVAAGLEQVLDYLETARFLPNELDWLKNCGRFRPDFIASLADWRFTGDVDAMPEGTIFFPDEPLLRVLAPLREAQLVETRIINLLQFQSMVAAKAVRSVFAANGRMLVDFGLRRAHGDEAGLLSARASFIAGFTGTATVLAGMRWEIPLFGTMAHSYIEVHAREQDAFENFAHNNPAGSMLLIDTYDTEQAAHLLVSLAPQLAAQGLIISGVRIDSGDLGEHAHRVRAILDAGDLKQIKIFASGNLDENRIHAILAGGAPIDGFGVGTKMNTSADQPYLDCAYKLQEYAGTPRRKRSEGKATWPGRKQVFRSVDSNGIMAGDLLAIYDETANGRGLLQPMLRQGKRLSASPSLAQIRAHLQESLSTMPAPLRRLEAAVPYPVQVSDAVRAMASLADRLSGQY